MRQRLVTRTGPGRSLVHALKGVSFDAYEGDAVGVIGSNGSGKSTLLAAIAGLLAADRRRGARRRRAQAPRRRGDAAAGGIRLPQHPARLPGPRACRPTMSRTASTRSSSSPSSARRSTGRCGRTPRACAPVSTSPSPRRCGRGSCSSTRRWAWATAGSGRSRRSGSSEVLDEAGTLMFVSHGLGEIRRQCTRGLWIEQGVLRADGDGRRGGRRVRRPHVLARTRRPHAPGLLSDRGLERGRRASGPKPTRPSDTATTP